ncbi:MAG: hypothetical protein PHE55_10245 [Methylococcaceae bacterium]|nr:hypothetical protein [Methylococcaceae bacterium]
MTRYLEFLADPGQAQQLPLNNWQAIAAHAKREALAIDNLDTFIQRYGRPGRPEQVRRLEDNLRSNSLTYVRALFLREQFMESPPNAQPGQGQHRVRTVDQGHLALNRAGLSSAVPPIVSLPTGSATLSLKFRLLTPLLTRDDDPFYLFDNPVRKDHIFGVPYLSAAGLKGLAADAYQRAFPGMTEWTELGPDDQARTARFRIQDRHALRLFGLADDGTQTGSSSAGRLHFSPVWFQAVQYIIINPTNKQTGLGEVPIQFEAIAPHLPNGKSVEVELQVFYFNPHGAPDSDEATVRGDLARWLASLATWWSILGLGAKRLAGYGAIEPIAAVCQAKDWREWKGEQQAKGPNSWMTLAERIAEGA